MPATSINSSGLIASVFLQLDGEGGAQRLARHGACSIAGFAAEHGLDYEVFGMVDPRGLHEVVVGGSSFVRRGFARSRITLACGLLALAPQLSLVHFGHVNLAPLIIALKMLRPSLPCSIQTHGIDVWEKRETAVRLGLRLATIVFALTDYSSRLLVSLQQVPQQKVRTVLPALDPKFAIYDECRNGEDIWNRYEAQGERRMRVLTVSRLVEPEKGIDTVISAIPQLVLQQPRLLYLVVGDGPERERLEVLALKLGVAPNVAFTGRVTDNTLAAIYQGCDVFVMPSCIEGFGLVFIEAMAAGKPVIGARAGAIPDFVIHGQNGLLVEYGDIEALSHELLTLLSDSHLRKRLGCEARRLVESNYTFERYRERFCRVLSEVQGLTT